MEISGPLTASTLARLFAVRLSEIETALLALEAEGFVLRGRFHQRKSGLNSGTHSNGTGSQDELEWCERRLLARIHRLTLNRLRAEIQPVSIADFQRFLMAWQRVEIQHRAEGIDGTRTALELFDGYELPA